MGRASDVWAFAVVLHEIWTRGGMPYSKWPDRKVVLASLTDIRTPHPPTTLTHTLYLVTVLHITSMYMPLPLPCSINSLQPTVLPLLTLQVASEVRAGYRLAPPPDCPRAIYRYSPALMLSSSCVFTVSTRVVITVAVTVCMLVASLWPSLRPSLRPSLWPSLRPSLCPCVWPSRLVHCC